MDKTIQINQMLMEREECFCDVYALEQKINSILGEKYPFDLPSTLPSLQRRKKMKRAAALRPPKAVRLRKLDEEAETAYRIDYLDHDVQKMEIHTDVRLLNLLVSTPLPAVTVLRVETVVEAEPGRWNAVDVLYADPSVEEVASQSSSHAEENEISMEEDF